MSRTLKPADGTRCSAVISPGGDWRYQLERVWDESRPTINVVGLNPSTADAKDDDPTIAKLTRMAKAWGYGSLVMTNLFAYRATDPKELAREARKYTSSVLSFRVTGPDNDEWLRDSARGATTTLAAWGANGHILGRDEEVITLLQSIRAIHALKVTQSGRPYHPLYLPESLEPFLWKPYIRQGDQ